MSKSIRVGLVGAGYVASRHLAALRDMEHVEIAGICDVDMDRANALAVKFRIPRVAKSLGELSEAGLNVVHILTPPQSHCALTLQALDMNCHVFVEKPMAETVEECDRMIARAQEKGLSLSVNHSLRFEAPVVEALERIASGALGDVLNVSYFRGSDYAPYAGGTPAALYRQGSYPFRDLGVHAIYLLEAFLGPLQKMDVRYYSTGTDPMIAFDEWRATVETKKATGSILLSWNMRPLQNEIWIQGTRGLAHIDVFLQQARFFRTYPGPKQFHFIVNGMRHAARNLFSIPWFLFSAVSGRIKPSPGIYASVVQFHRALAEGRPAPVTPEEGRRAVSWVTSGSKAADEEKDRMERDRAALVPKPARVLVTGGSGFLGSALVRRLRSQGVLPRVFLRRPAPAGSACDGLDAVYGSLGEPEAVDRAVAGVEVVYHVGAAMKGGALEFEAGTIWGTRNMVDACVKHGVKRLVYISSCGVLDHAGHQDGVPVTEMSPMEPNPAWRGTYTQTKLQAERMVQEAIRERNLPAVILRPGQIFGPGAEQVTPNGVIKIAGQWIVAGSGDRQLPLVYVEDVVDGMLAAETSKDALGKTIHLVDPTPVTQNQYLEWCKPAIGSAKIRRTPVGLLMLLGRICDVMAGVLKRSLPLSRYKVRSLKPLSPADISTARALLGWSPAIGSGRGLELTFARFRKER